MNKQRPLKILVIGGDKTYKSTLCKILIGESPSTNYIHTLGINIYKTVMNEHSIIYWDVPFSEFNAKNNLPLITESVDGVIIMINKDIDNSVNSALDWYKLLSKYKDVTMIGTNIKDFQNSPFNENFQGIETILTLQMNKKRVMLDRITTFIQSKILTKPISTNCIYERKELANDTPSSSSSASVSLSKSANANLTPTPNFGKVITLDFLNQKKLEVSKMFSKLDMEITNIKILGEKNIYTTFKQQQIDRLKSHIIMEEKALSDVFEDYKSMLEKKDNVKITENDINEMIFRLKESWKKNFEYLKENLDLKKLDK